jgi:hypothetical protein
MHIRRCLFAALMVAICPGAALAQSEPLSQVLVNLLVRSVSMPSTVQAVPGNPHEAHFLPSLAQTQAPFEINKALVAELGTFPIGSSSAGFSFSFNPSTGLFSRTSQSFGPGFAERALTSGRNRFSFGLNYQRLDFNQFEDTDLNSSSSARNISFVLQHNDCCPGQTLTGTPGGSPSTDPKDPFFEGDLVRASLALVLKTDVVAPFLNYGLTDRWDVGIVVPIVRVQLQPTITSTIDRVSTASNPLIHSFDGNGLSVKTVSVSGSATGIGDVVLRTKYRFLSTTTGGLAAGLDVRLPSGDKENLLGTGAVQTKLSLIASGEYSRIAPHVNLGYQFSQGDLSSSLATILIPSDLPGASTPYQTIFSSGAPASSVDLTLPDEFDYAAGVDFAAHQRVTISADLLGRALLDVKRFGTVTQNFTYRTATSGPVFQAPREVFDVTGSGTLNLLVGVVGAKVNIPGTPLLITGSVLFPLTSDGLRPNVTPVIGLDYAFGR